MSKSTKITLTISENSAAYLQQLARSSAIETGSIEDVLNHLVASAVEGVARPGAWERGWVAQAFGDFPEGSIDPNAPYRRLPILTSSAK